MKGSIGKLLTAVLAGGMIAGTIDIGVACLINQVGPIIILHAIASGALGPAAFRGGAKTALWGLLLQWGMSCLIAAVYVVARHFVSWLGRHWISGGLLYGVVVFTVMNYVVVPLSAVRPTHYWTLERVLHRLPPEKFIEALLAMFLFALIIAFFTHRANLGTFRSSDRPQNLSDPGIKN